MAENVTPTRSVAMSHVASLKLTPSNSPSLRPTIRSPIRPLQTQSSLTLDRVIGTTTTSPSGLACHEASRVVAFCAGSAVVLAELDEDCHMSQRFYKAKPTALPVNLTSSFHNATQGSGTPERRRKPVAPVRNGAQSYSPAASPTREWLESGGSKTWTSRERIKTATAVCLSPDGRLLAVGETGYSPRVLIFSTAKDAPRDIPVSILAEHSFGIRTMAFSPDSLYLATLGDTNDGFLFVWSINIRTGSAKLHSTNKCTAFVNGMSWMGTNIVTVGTRHVKVWRVLDQPQTPSPTKSGRLTADAETPGGQSPKALSGRNCLLGNLVDSKFTAVIATSDREAVVCTSRGDICLIDDTEGQQQLKFVKNVGFRIQCVTVDKDKSTLILGGKYRGLVHEVIEDLPQLARVPQTQLGVTNALASLSSSAPHSSALSDHTGTARSRNRDLIALASILGKVFIVDADRSVSLTSASTDIQESEREGGVECMPAHRDAVLGVEALHGVERKCDFLTWSRDGEVICWKEAGGLQQRFKVELDQLDGEEDEVRNELKIVRSTANGDCFFTGDKYGVVRILRGSENQNKHEIRAHGAEVTDITIDEGPSQILVATSGKDRMVQLFASTPEKAELLQTMDDHVGTVNNVLFVKEGQSLLSSSLDRTVIVREQITRSVEGIRTIAYVPTRVITLKASPISMAMVPGEPDWLMVSTMNHHVLRLDMRTGLHLHTFRATDPESNDMVLLHSLKVTARTEQDHPRIMAGVSSTDKSVRIYDLDRGQFLTREFGHSEGISDLALLESKHQTDDLLSTRKIVSTGLDGTVMIWKFSMQRAFPLQEIGLTRGAGSRALEADEKPSRDSIATKPPLRRVLSRSELADSMILDPSTSSGPSTPGRLRTQSPPRAGLRRKSSRPTLNSQHSFSRARGSPSPPPVPNIPELGVSTANIGNGGRAAMQKSSTSRDGSPSPPLPQSPGPRTPNRANNSRLRRPPSVPADLRLAGRGKSSNDATRNLSTIQQSHGGSKSETDASPRDVGGTGHDDMCEALRRYRKRFDEKNGHILKVDGDMKVLEEVRTELGITVRVVEERLRGAGGGVLAIPEEDRRRTGISIGMGAVDGSAAMAGNGNGTGNGYGSNGNGNRDGGTVNDTMVDELGDRMGDPGIRGGQGIESKESG